MPTDPRRLRGDAPLLDAWLRFQEEAPTPFTIPGHKQRHDLVVLPDEPYAFTADDGPESFAAPAALVSGRHLTWYGPSLVEARAVLTAQLAG